VSDSTVSLSVGSSGPTKALAGIAESLALRSVSILAAGKAANGSISAARSSSNVVIVSHRLTLSAPASTSKSRWAKSLLVCRCTSKPASTSMARHRRVSWYFSSAGWYGSHTLETNTLPGEISQRRRSRRASTSAALTLTSTKLPHGSWGWWNRPMKRA